MTYDVFAIDDAHFEVRRHQDPVMQVEADSEEQAVLEVGKYCEVDEDGITLALDDADVNELDEIIDNYRRCNLEGRRQIAVTAMMAARTFPAGDNVIMFKRY